MGAPDERLPVARARCGRRCRTCCATYIAEMHRRLESQDKVRFKLHAMGTELEGKLEDILEVVRELHNVPFEAGLPRVYTVLKIDERRDRPAQTLEDKVRSVEEKLRGSKGA